MNRALRLGLRAAAAIGMLCGPGLAYGQSDEIQVYDGGLAPVRVANLTLHMNVTPQGVSEPAFPGAVVADQSFNTVPEWALGVTPWFEAGLYLPLVTHDVHQGWGVDGLKLRTLFAVPNADQRRFVYGANFEFSVNADRWDEHRITSEIRPIIGWHLERWDLFVNPILDTAYDGFENLEFAPSARVAYKVSDAWAMAAEEYADFGPIHDFLPVGEQSHQVYGVLDRAGKPFDIEFGAGVGLTDASDRFTLKVIFSRDLNR